MKTLDDNESARLSKPTGMDGENGESRSGVIGNERLTALAGAVLLVLILLELVSSSRISTRCCLSISLWGYSWRDRLSSSLARPATASCATTPNLQPICTVVRPAYHSGGSPHCCSSPPSRSRAPG